MLEEIGSKLVGSDDERAVSPVIGVILMVAITVILAAVIAAFVLDLGDSIDEEANAGVNLDVDETDNGNITVEITSLGNSDYVTLSGSVTDQDPASGGDSDDNAADELELVVGDTVTLNYNDVDTNPGGLDGEVGTVTAVAVIEEDDTRTQVGSADYEGFEDNQ